MPHKYLFQPLRHASFLALCFYITHHQKNCQAFKACQTKSICAGTMKLGQHLYQTKKNTQKTLQVAPIFRDSVIIIFVIVNFCESKLYRSCTAAVQSEKVWYVESCLGREPKGIGSFPTSTSSPRHYSIRRNYHSAVTLEGGSLFTSFGLGRQLYCDLISF
jgi:hypothetical protein